MLLFSNVRIKHTEPDNEVIYNPKQPTRAKGSQGSLVTCQTWFPHTLIRDRGND